MRRVVKELNKLTLVFFIIVLILASTVVAGNNDNSIYHRIEAIYEKIYMLNKDHIDTTELVNSLNTELAKWENGTISTKEFLNYLDHIEQNISMLKEKVGEVSLINLLVKTTSIVLFIAIPIIFYYYFPRFYIWLWIRIYRNRVVKNGSA